MEEEVELELNTYFVSYTLHIDIDEVRAWPYVKLYKWMIAIRMINEKMHDAQEDAMTGAEISAAQSSGDKVIVRNSQYC